MTTPLRSSPSPAQRGAATIFMTLMLLLIAGLVLLYTSRGAVMEARLSANEIRAKQAFAAASAGLDNALYAIQIGTGPVPTINAATLANSGGANTSTYYTVALCQAGATATCPTAHGTAPTCNPATAPASAKDVLVAACGWSDDDSAVHLVSQRIVGTPSLPSSIPNPLISRGAAGLTTGGASVFNFFSDLTVWSGQAMTSLSSNSKTYVRDTANASYQQGTRTLDADGTAGPDYLNPLNPGGTATCSSVAGYTCSSKGTTLGHDTVTGDTRLTQGTASDFFKMFFGDTPSNYESSVPDYRVDLNNTLTGENSTSASSLNGLTDKTIWVAGDLSVPAGSVIGSPSNPVILIVDGNMNLGSNFTIYGIVYATQGISGQGSPNIVGSMITAGNVSINGSPNIIYDPFTGTKLGQNGIATKMPGSWKDW